MAAPSVVWMNGELVPWTSASVPVEDRGLQFAESLYEVLPVTRGRGRLLDEHHARMARAADVLELRSGLPDGDGWRRIAETLIDAEALDEGLLYLQLTGGAAPRDHAPDPRPRPLLFAYLRPFRFPREKDAARGVTAITLPDERWTHCHLKTTMLLPAVFGRREAARRGANEAFLLAADGHVREGTSSNVFIVEGRRIVSPRSTEHVLPGVTRPLIGALADETGYEVAEEVIPRNRLGAADEVLITSTSRLVLGVTAIDDTPVGDGTPGPTALELGRRARAFFEID